MLNAISILVAFLMHLPELIALSNPVADNCLFPDFYWGDVSSGYCLLIFLSCSSFSEYKLMMPVIR